MKCTDEKCNGEIDTAKVIKLHVHCHSFAPASPCNVCGKVHWPDGTAAINRQGEKTFLKDGGKKLVVVDKDGNETDITGM